MNFPRTTADFLIAVLGSYCGSGFPLSATRHDTYRAKPKDLIEVRQELFNNNRDETYTPHLIKLKVRLDATEESGVKGCVTLHKQLPLYNTCKSFEIFRVRGTDHDFKNKSKENEESSDFADDSFYSFVQDEYGSFFVKSCECVFQISGHAFQHRRRSILGTKKSQGPVPVKLTVGSKIKMGAVTIEITELSILSKFESKGSLEQGGDKNSALNQNEMVGNSCDLCYICLGPTEDKSPCQCSAAVHPACLQQWSHQSDSSCCPICKKHMTASVLFRGKSFMTFIVRRRTRNVPWVGQKEFSFELTTEKSLILGRGGAGVNNITLPDPSLSWQHASFKLTKENILIVQDLVSYGGTYVSVEKNQALQCFDGPISLLLGKNMFVDLEITEPRFIKRMHRKLCRWTRIKSATVASKSIEDPTTFSR